MAQVADIEAAEKGKMKDKVNQILKHDINCFINRQLIYNYPEQLFADAKVMAIEHADFEGVERLALVLGGDVVSTFDAPEKVKLGTCDLIEEVMIGEEKLIKFSGYLHMLRVEGIPALSLHVFVVGLLMLTLCCC